MRHGFQENESLEKYVQTEQRQIIKQEDLRQHMNEIEKESLHGHLTVLL